jgi:hypothetical protein
MIAVTVAMATVTGAEGITDNNQPKGVAEEMTTVVTVMVVETTMATKTAMVTAMITMPTTAH